MELPRSEPEQGIVGDLVALTKARLNFYVIITTFVGFCMASGHSLDWLRLFNAVLGTTLAAFGAAALNQVLESKVDRLMERTKSRPIPSGRMRLVHALMIGVAMSVFGVVHLWFTTNALSAILAAATVLIYIFLYTPLKRKTSFCTVVGAVSGAIPPVVGWTAVEPTIGLGAWVLFGILFTWQMPHFLAIAWMYRDEYAQAGFVMLKRDDVSGSSTALQSLIYTFALLVISLIPVFSGVNNMVYLVAALILNGAMLACAVEFLTQRTRVSARRLFFASIIFLPVLLGIMVFTKA
jgi:protoheme IX farnesyltransferase